MRHISFVACLVFAVPAFAADTPLTGDNTKIEFTGTKKDGKHDGGFKTVTGTASYDGSDFATLKVKVDITTDSLFADDPKLTTHLKGPDFFDVKTFPKATFTSKKVEKKGDGYVINGTLTLHGKTKAISIPVTPDSSGGLKFAGEFKLNRQDFGIVYGKGMIDDDVTVKVSVDAKK